MGNKEISSLEDSTKGKGDFRIVCQVIYLKSYYRQCLLNIDRHLAHMKCGVGKCP